MFYNQLYDYDCGTTALANALNWKGIFLNYNIENIKLIKECKTTESGTDFTQLVLAISKRLDISLEENISITNIIKILLEGKGIIINQSYYKYPFFPIFSQSTHYQFCFADEKANINVVNPISIEDKLIENFTISEFGKWLERKFRNSIIIIK